MKYFFDTNVVSRLVKEDDEAIAKLQELASNEENEFYINGLVFMESLRAIPLTHKKLYDATKETLESFIKLETTQEIYDKSVSFSRFCKSKGISLGKCEAIDYLHFMTAKHYSLEIVSFDNDMKVLEEKYNDWILSNYVKPALP
ncbi:putative nucleic acid-binding protein [Beggiatoa alba B18LD]|uniref:Putative nucleic acid-binding protein n=1 Tax=Beggiatoa alba B18LD TaxID=395493 RepID=I3CIA9_9GAMM|nr:PIN domain-containing protein [Beggiatoa alba]EIJ43352.1 putative nucleic acid-binding protein [Beggiatoa alba B18LD]